MIIPDDDDDDDDNDDDNDDHTNGRDGEVVGDAVQGRLVLLQKGLQGHFSNVIEAFDILILLSIP